MSFQENVLLFGEPIQAECYKYVRRIQLVRDARSTDERFFEVTRRWWVAARRARSDRCQLQRWFLQIATRVHLRRDRLRWSRGDAIVVLIITVWMYAIHWLGIRPRWFVRAWARARRWPVHRVGAWQVQTQNVPAVHWICFRTIAYRSRRVRAEVPRCKRPPKAKWQRPDSTPVLHPFH